MGKEVVRGLHTEHDVLQKLLLHIVRSGDLIEDILGKDNVAASAATTSGTDSYA